MSTFAIFADQHRGIERAIDDVCAFLGEQQAPAIEPLANARWRLGFLVAQHLTAEDTHFYPRLFADSRPEVKAIVQHHAGEIGVLRACFREWQTGWTAERIADDWRGFCTETKRLIDALEQRAKDEEHLLFPLLEEPNFTPSSAHAMQG